MELRQIQYFIAIAELEHFGHASRRLNIAQPALTRQMKILEKELGVELFERLPRGVKLTPAGRVFLTHVHDLRDRLDHAMLEARSAAAGLSGTLRLGVIEVAAWRGMVPEGIRQFRASQPDVRLLLTAMSGAEQIEAIRSKTLDAGLIYNAPAQDEFNIIPLEAHPVMLACHAGTRFADMEEISLADLAGEDFIGFQRAESPKFFDDLRAAFDRKGFAPRVIAEMKREADMLALVSAGAGVAFVNSCQRFRPPFEVRFRRIRDLDVRLTLSFVHLQTPNNAILNRFAQTLGSLAYS